jgi:hypothetical protein
MDGYQSSEQFVKICQCFFTSNDVRGRACFLISHFGLLRVENIRDLELADMFSQVLDGGRIFRMHSIGCIDTAWENKYVWKASACRVYEKRGCPN